MTNLQALENEFNNIEKIRNSMINAKLVQLHTGLEGFDSPETFGVYRSTGGAPLGVVGNRYKPMDLNIMLDSIVQSVNECGVSLDLSKMTYNEYKGGSKVSFKIPLPVREIKGSPMVGDLIESNLEFRTGFDGLTKSRVKQSYKRLWCANGCASWTEQGISFKNTINNHAKIYNLCNYIVKGVSDAENFIFNFGKLAEIKVSQRDIDAFLTKVTGYNVAEYKEMTTRKQNILDAINGSCAIEMRNTGANMFSLVNGITRYVTHERSGGSEELIHYSSATKLNDNALKYAFAQLN